MSKAYEKIHLMNSLMGHQGVEPDSEEFWKQIRNQVDLVVEETVETQDEAIDEQLAELLKETSDIMVTAIGLYQKLQLCGLPIDNVLEAVCDNNLEKFHQDGEEANKTVKFYQDQGVDTFVRMITLEDGSEYYSVIHKGSGKMLKPYNFVKLKMKDYHDEIQVSIDRWRENSETKSTEE